jgi:hypothetical protein
LNKSSTSFFAKKNIKKKKKDSFITFKAFQLAFNNFSMEKAAQTDRQREGGKNDFSLFLLFVQNN